MLRSIFMPSFFIYYYCFITSFVLIKKVEAATYAEQTTWWNSDFYGMLGVSKDVETRELKKVYRKLARTFHPDKYETSGPEIKQVFTKDEAANKFLEISGAYEILKDEDKRKEYDEFIASIPARFRPVYGESRLAKADVWVVILGFLLALTGIQYVSQRFKFNSFVKFWKTRDDVQQWGMEQTEEDYQKQLKTMKKMTKQDKRILRAQLVDDFLTLKSKDLDVKGGYKKLVWHELIIVRFFCSPYTIPRWFFALLSYTLRLLRNTPTEDDKIYWTKGALKMKDTQWEQLDDEDKEEYVSKELWISANMAKHQKEQQEEYMKSNPAQMKRYLRWKKKNR